MKKIIESYLGDKTMKEKKEVKKAKSTGKTKKWYENLRKITKEHLEVANSIEEFKENFLKNGDNIKFSEKNITVTDKENLSVRLKTLDKTYTDEYVFEMFEKKGKELTKSENDDKKNFIKKIRRKRCYKNSAVRCSMRREFHYVKFATRKF